MAATDPRTDQVEHRQAVILSCDAVGYSRLMADDAAQTIHTLKGHRLRMAELVAAHSGRVVDEVGDNLLAEFSDVLSGVRCAAAIQPALSDANSELEDHRRMPFRIGIHVGEVLAEGGRIYGHSVNVAARLESLAPAGGVCVSEAVHDRVRDALPTPFEDTGSHSLKNIPAPVRVFRLQLGTEEQPESQSPSPDPAFMSRPAIAVLPFANRSADPEQQYFVDGVCEDVISRLSKIGSFRVIAQASSFAYRGKEIDARRVGAELGVRYLVEGSVRRAGKRIRISAFLVDTRSGDQVWGSRYDRELEDIFDLQDEITGTIVSQMHPELLRKETARARNSPSQLDAWDRVLRGGFYIRKPSKENLLLARAELLRATELAPDSVNPHYMLALTYHFELANGWADDPSRAIAELGRLADFCLEINSSDPDAQLANGIACLFRGDIDRALAALKFATQLDPNSIQAQGFAGGALAIKGNPEDALEHLEAAMRLSPRDPVMWLFLCDTAAAHFAAMRFGDCVRAAEASLNLRANQPRAQALRGASYGMLGDLDAARSAVEALLEIAPGFDPEEPGPLLEHTDPNFGARLVKGLHAGGLGS